MSFGDIATTPSGPSASSAYNELHRLLKPLALNNAALRDTATELSRSTAPSPGTLKRMRALREQNRHIAGAAASIVAQADDDGSANDAAARAELKALLDDFSSALAESAAVERDVLPRMNAPPSSPRISQQWNSSKQQLNENDVALQLYDNSSADDNDENAGRYRNNEGTHLLSVGSPPQRSQLAYRSADMRDGFIAERRAALSDIQSSVDDVNAIFKDLASLVDDQRSQVDYVDVAVADSVSRVDLARREIEKTQRRRNSRKSFFFCTLFSIAFAIAIFLIILLT